MDEQPCNRCKTEDCREMFKIIAKNNDYGLCNHKYKHGSYKDEECNNLVYDKDSVVCDNCQSCWSSQPVKTTGSNQCQYIFSGMYDSKRCVNFVTGSGMKGVTNTVLVVYKDQKLFLNFLKIKM